MAQARDRVVSARKGQRERQIDVWLPCYYEIGLQNRKHSLARVSALAEVADRFSASVTILISLLAEQDLEVQMQVELPFGDYVLAAIAAVAGALLAGLLTLVPAIVYFDWLAHLGTSFWARGLFLLPVGCGVSAAWSTLRRAKRDRMRDQLWRELRN